MQRNVSAGSIQATCKTILACRLGRPQARCCELRTVCGAGGLWRVFRQILPSCLARLASGALPAVVLNSMLCMYMGVGDAAEPSAGASLAAKYVRGRQPVLQPLGCKIAWESALSWSVSAAETPKTPSMITRETPCHTKIDHSSSTDYGATSDKALNCTPWVALQGTESMVIVLVNTLSARCGQIGRSFHCYPCATYYTRSLSRPGPHTWT